jgi:UPF0755 protein
MTMRRLLYLLLVLIGVGAAVAGGAWYSWRALNTPVRPPGSGVVVSIQRGAPFRSVAQQLRRAGILRHPILLATWAQFIGADRSVRSGEYRVAEAVSPLQLLELLQSPSRALRWVTIPEGFTVDQIADLLEEKKFGGRDVFVAAMQDASLLTELELPASGVEGYLFPDTYAWEWAMEPGEIVRAMLSRFQQESAALREARIAAGLTEHEMVTLASVIERETGKDEERPLISGVFHNRLRIGMPLQSDPTVLYSLGRTAGRLRRADLANPSPYNTYVRRGLPPGPIANPGSAALRAAIAPAQTAALYFVSRNDGSHQFSDSLAEHNRAVNLYQRRKGGP